MVQKQSKEQFNYETLLFQFAVGKKVRDELNLNEKIEEQEK